MIFCWNASYPEVRRTPSLEERTYSWPTQRRNRDHSLREACFGRVLKIHGGTFSIPLCLEDLSLRGRHMDHLILGREACREVLGNTPSSTRFPALSPLTSQESVLPQRISSSLEAGKNGRRRPRGWAPHRRPFRSTSVTSSIPFSVILNMHSPSGR